MHVMYCSNCTDNYNSSYLDKSFYCYSGGELVAGIIVPIFLLGGISVATHLAVYRWIYKPRMKPQSGVSVDGENITEGGCGSHSHNCEGTGSVTVSEMKQNEAYYGSCRGPCSGVPETQRNEAYEVVLPETRQNEAYGRGPPNAVPKIKQNVAYGKGPPMPN